MYIVQTLYETAIKNVPTKAPNYWRALFGLTAKPDTLRCSPRKQTKKQKTQKQVSSCRECFLRSIIKRLLRK